MKADMGEGLPNRLRRATAQAHRDLEEALDWKARVATLEGYADLLAKLRGFHATYEPAIARALGDEEFFGPRRRLHLLDADLDHFGWDRNAVAALPEPSDVVIDGHAQAMGTLYVLEGSTLGGTVILRHLRSLHAIEVGHGGSYYGARGQAVGRVWSAMQAALATLSGHCEAEEAATRAAIDTFSELRLWLVPDSTGATRSAGTLEPIRGGAATK